MCQSRAPRPVRRVKATLPKSQLASVDTLGFLPLANASHESKEENDILSRMGGRHRLPRIAGELSSVMAGTSPTASFSKSKSIGVSRARFISWFSEYT